MKKKPPPNFVPWDATTFKTLIEKDPEPLESRFVVSHAMLLTLLQQTGNGYRRLVQLIGRSHDRPALRSRHRRRARELFRSLVAGGIVSIVRNRERGARVVVNDELQRNFSLNQTLSLFLLDALRDLQRSAGESAQSGLSTDADKPLSALGRDGESYAQEKFALDVVSLVESILESPRVILASQVNRAKGERVAELKAAGMEYNERMEELEKVEHPKPNAEQIYGAFDVFRVKHPWAAEDNVRPKSIAREMYENIATFHEYVRDYGLERSEGVLLRYLSDFYRTLWQTVPETARTDALFEIAVYFRGMLERVDDSLVREWEQLVNPTDSAAVEAPKAREHVYDPLRDMKGFTARVRAELHQIVKALSDRAYGRVIEIVRDSGIDDKAIAAMVEPYWTQHQKLRSDHEARLPSRTLLTQEGPRQFRARQTLADPLGTDEWMIETTIDLDEASEPDAPLLTLVRIGT